LSEQLASLEASWRTAQVRSGIDAQERQYNLAKLGHILHAVEDYFFHSNLPEAHVWAAARTATLQTAPNQEPSRAVLLPAALSRTAQGLASVPLLRLLNRRLRYPVYEASGKLSTTGSVDATDLICTGGFGQTDVWHTLGGALEALEDQLDHVQRVAPEYDPRNTSLVLFKMLLSRSARAEMVNKKTLETQRSLHLKQLLNGEYHIKIGHRHELPADRVLAYHQRHARRVRSRSRNQQEVQQARALPWARGGADLHDGRDGDRAEKERSREGRT
jgi:hypothetical protein